VVYYEFIGIRSKKHGNIHPSDLDLKWWITNMGWQRDLIHGIVEKEVQNKEDCIMEQYETI